MKEVSQSSSESYARVQDGLQHVISSLVASTAAGGSTAVQNFAVQRVRLGFFFRLVFVTDSQL